MTANRRNRELEKYRKAYQDDSYRMSQMRKKVIETLINMTPLSERESFLDIGCGRGEAMAIASELGFSNVCGIDPITTEEVINNQFSFSVGVATNIPFEGKSFEWVSCFDVMEHLIPEDTLSALREMERVSKSGVLLCISNAPSKHNGINLHINIKPYEEWDKIIRDEFSDSGVTWVKELSNPSSECWIVNRRKA